MTRHTLSALAMVVLLVTTAAGAAPAAAQTADSETLLSGALSDAAGLTGLSVGEDVIKYSGNPSVIVTVEDSRMSALETWTDGSEERQLVSSTLGENRALVAAPPDEIGASTLDQLLGNGLAARSYVTGVDLNRQIRTDPVLGLANASSYERPPAARIATLRGGELSAAGQAWSSDANRSTLGEARSAIGADDVAADGAGVTVAVLDTGANINETNDPLYGNRSTAPYNAITNTSGYDAVATDTYHGPWVTAAIAANASNDSYDGVAPEATVMPVKVLGDDGGGSVASIIRGVEHADEHGADVVSMSLGSATYSPALASTVEEALAGNVTTVVVAVGNSKQNPAKRFISSPADTDAPGVIAVAATNTSAADSAAPAYFSEVGPDGGTSDLSRGVTAGEGPDVAAPGMKVVAPYLERDGDRRNLSLSGTSMATPLVSGVAALTLEANNELVNDSEGTRSALLDSAQPIPAAGVTEVGNGMVDAPNATATVDVDASQADQRNAPARGRDTGNEAYSGSRLVEFLVGREDS